MIKFIIAAYILIVAMSCDTKLPDKDKEKNLQPLQSKNDSCAGYRISNNKVYLLDDWIMDADPKSFKCLHDGFSKDKYHVFFGLKKIAKADPKTFMVLESGYSKDRKYVYYDYYSGNKIAGADAKTFEVFDLITTKDKNFVYRNEIGKILKVKGIDAKSFRQYNDGYYVDKTYLYNFVCEKIARLDTINIESLLESH